MYIHVAMNELSSAAGVVLCLALLVSCTKPDDEALLQKRIDVAASHVYLGLKVVLTRPAQDPDVARTRELLGGAFARLQKQAVEARKRGADAVPHLDATDALALARALWAVRSLGQAELKQGRGSHLPTLLSAAQADSQDTWLRALVVSPEIEHALLLVLLTIARVHPQVHTPVPESLLLYEAWMMGDATLTNRAQAALRSLDDTLYKNEAELTRLGMQADTVARSAQAYVYAGAELCDLARKATQALPKPEREGNRLGDAIQALSGLGPAAAHAPEAVGLVLQLVILQTLPWTAPMLAHVETAKCLKARGDLAGSNEELQRAIDGAEAAGVAPEDLALLRAYLALGAEEPEQAHAQLVLAQQSSLLDGEEKRELAQLVGHFDPKERSAISSFLDSSFVSLFVLRIVHHRLEKSGVYRALARMPQVQAIRGLYEDLAAPLAPAQGVYERGRSWLDARWRQWMGT